MIASPRRTTTLLVLVVLTGCEAGPEGAAGLVENAWDPGVGRGLVRVTTAAGERIEVHLHDGFAGYSGGLLLGALNEAAYTLRPPGGDAETPPVTLWCAQDESIYRRDVGLEYAHGWSENFGRGPDGVSLRYLGGAVVAEDERGVILAAENGASPFHLARWLWVRPDGTVLVRLEVTNVGRDPVSFELWTGDDPWVGGYGTARGDVGWVPGRLVTNETSIAPDEADCLGIADLQGSGDGSGGRLTAADCLCLSPRLPAPDLVLFANGFAHAEDEIDPSRPLEGDTMTAFNLGWVDRSLAPGETLALGYALGAADLGDGQGAPRAPDLPPDVWTALDGLPLPVDADPEQTTAPLAFTRERVELEVLDGAAEVEVRGWYWFRNLRDEELFQRIYFPFAVDPEHPYPRELSVSVGPVQRLPDGVIFPLTLPPGGEELVEIRYRQGAADSTATYILTSARSWAEPLDRAELSVSVPAELASDVELSYPMDGPEIEAGRALWTLTVERFFPDRELTVRWGG